MKATPYGFRIVGACDGERRLVDADAAFLAYAACDERAAVEREAYLSAFTFGEDFRELLESTGSCRGFQGACWSAWLWFDIDRAELDAALHDARRLSLWLIERYQLDDCQLLIFFSGSKGFHIGLPSSLWGTEPSPLFNCVCRRLAERIGEVVGISIDTGVYDKVRAFRAPNSQHPKTGLHKRRLMLDELTGLSLDGIQQLAAKPMPFDVPTPPPLCEQAKADWLEAAELVGQASEAKAKRTANGKPTLNRQTLHFIRDGAGEGDRHRILYSAARNLAEFSCPSALAHALLTESALDCGLPPSETARQIECGLKDQGQLPEQTPMPSAAATLGIQEQLAALWQSPAMQAVEPIPDAPGDAWEHPFDRLDSVAGPYGREGGRL